MQGSLNTFTDYSKEVGVSDGSPSLGWGCRGIFVVCVRLRSYVVRSDCRRVVGAFFQHPAQQRAETEEPSSSQPRQATAHVAADSNAINEDTVGITDMEPSTQG